MMTRRKSGQEIGKEVMSNNRVLLAALGWIQLRKYKKVGERRDPCT